MAAKRKRWEIFRGFPRLRSGCAILVGALLLTLSAGCATQESEIGRSEQIEQEAKARVLAGVSKASENPIQVASFEQPAKNGDEPEKKNELVGPPEKVTLPRAIELCVNNNFRVRQAAERIRIAEADLITSSLIPNSSAFVDSQLIPLQRADLLNQLGPPQYDAILSVPIDWLVFGKRVAAVKAAKIGVDVNAADFADTLRLQLARTVDTFYEVLGAEEYLRLAKENHAELSKIEQATKEMAKAEKAGNLELNRLKLAVLEAYLEIHGRELALISAKSRLRPLIGRTAGDPDFEVVGVLEVKAVVPPPKLQEAVALADANRPDLHMGRHAIDQAQAIVNLERRRARPQISLQPGWSYQDQHSITGFRNGSMFDIGIATTLPFTDRNQGNIRRALAQAAEKQLDYAGDRADALAQVESTLGEYEDAVEDVTENNTPETLKAAQDLFAGMEAAFRKGDRRLGELITVHHAYRERLARVVEFEENYWRKLNKLNAVVGLKAFDPEKGPTKPIEKH